MSRSEQKGLDVRGLQAAPPYVENESTEEAWLRADLASTASTAREIIAAYCGLDDEGAEGLCVVGVEGMCPDEADEYHERWMVCDDAQAFGRYWHVSFT